MHKVRIVYRVDSSRADKDGIVTYSHIKVRISNQNKSIETIENELKSNLNRKVFSDKLAKYGMRKGVLLGFDII